MSRSVSGLIVSALTLLFLGCHAPVGPKCHFEGQSAGPEFNVEIVNDNQGRQTGLMYRREMDQRQGMLFVYPKVERHSHWMRNTYISLDMLFLGEDRKVVGIVPEVPILNDMPRGVDRDSLYVLELVAGEAARLGIKDGDVLVCDNPIPTGY